MSTATTTITDMFAYDFMINAFAAAGIVAVVSGVVGYFLVMRGQTFRRPRALAYRLCRRDRRRP